jgi:Skp family chaperone for outer membrane proteins
MKKLLQMTAATVTAFGLCVILLPANAVAADQKIATIDLAKVFENYYKTVRSTAALKQEAADMQKARTDLVDAKDKQVAEYQKLLDKSEDQAISADERAKSKKDAIGKLKEAQIAERDIEDYSRRSDARLRETERQRRDDIVKEIRGVLNADAKAGGYNLVLDISGESANMAPVILFSSGVPDLTDSLIKELNAGAPPAPADEKDTKDLKGVK